MNRSPIFSLLFSAALLGTGWNFSSASSIPAEGPSKLGNATTRTVTNLNDSGAGSLRQTIAVASAGDTINFSVNGVIVLTSGELLINKSLTIVGPGDANILIASNQEQRIFHVTTGTVSISNVDINAGGAIGASGTPGTVTNKNGGVGSPGLGGGLYNGGSVTLTNCTFVSNQARGGRGGDAFADGTGGDGGDGQGAAIYNAGTAVLYQCTLYNNWATGGTGGDGADGGLSGNGGNGATGEGGAIYNIGDLTLVNCTIDGQIAFGGLGGTGLTGGAGGDASGGGVFQAAGSITFLNTLLALNNSVAGEGGTSLAGGSAPDGVATGPDISETSGLVSLGHNLIGKANGSTSWLASDLTGTIDAPLDPVVGPFGSSGYPFDLIPLLTGSPAIDAGDDAVLDDPYNLTTDNRDLPRKLDTHVDIGAFEFDLPQAGPTFIVTTLDDHSDNVAGTFDCTLGEAITASTPVANAKIVFTSGLTGTLQLRATPDQGNLLTHFYIDHPVSIEGPGARVLTIQGGANLGHIFEIAGQGVSISELTLAGGRAGLGTAIFNHGILTVSDCTFTDNQTVPDGSATLTGGAIQNELSAAGDVQLTVDSCTFDNNFADDSGGAIGNTGAIATITNCTFISNSASKGGAIYSASFPGYTTSLTLQSCTLGGNSATGGDNLGGGIYAESGPATVTNSIIAGNAAPSGAPDVFGTFTSGGHNLIGISDAEQDGFISGVNGDQVGTFGNPLDPRLASLQDNGGPTDTLALLADSPAINGAVNAPDRDQRGYVRSDAPDIGAFEFGGTIPVTLANISTRLRVETSDNVLIGGFIMTGTHSKKVALRAIGPSLPVTGALADPTLELHDATGAVIATNDNWQTNPNLQEIIDAELAPANPLESVILTTLDPGPYTAIVRGASNSTGIALVEAYDLDRTTNAKLANISTRGLVQTGDNLMIGGFIILGPDSEDVIVRAIGPSLPLTGKLADPTLELHDSDGSILTTNDDWRATQEDEIIATGVPPTDDAESAIVVTLSPGAYTAIVRGAGGGTGVALVEVYGLN